jgi:long-chain acyl-CoA synthetase
MIGFIGPFVCGACVVHLRTLRPEFVRDAFVRYRITHVTLVPMIVKNLERGLRANFDGLPGWKRFLLDRMISINIALTGKKPNVKLSRWLLPGVHRAFGGALQILITGGAFLDPATAQFFYDLGIPVANGYGLTEACTVLTVNDLKPFRADTVGKPLPGVELRILNPDEDGIGEVAANSRTIMSQYLDDPELTAETIIDGWLLTGDLGRVDGSGHLQLFGRKKNMIVTEGGKNIHPEDIESVFEGVAIKEYCVFAADYIWPRKELTGEKLLLVLHPDSNQEVTSSIQGEIASRNRRLPDFKRVGGYLIWGKDFPRTVKMDIKRTSLAQEIRDSVGRTAVREL